MTNKIEPIRPTTPEAIRLAKTILRTSRYAAIAVLEPNSGRPLATRVALATDSDGTPIILVSSLAAHTPALLFNPSCSILVGEPGKGDALAHPRMTLHCRARKITREDPQYARVRRRYLNHNPKGSLYVDLGDFSFFVLDVESASLNGGFGKAFNLSSNDILSDAVTATTIETGEQSALDHMNADHADAIALYASHYAKLPATSRPGLMTGIDPEGFNIAAGDDVGRIFFETPITSPSDVHHALVKMAKQARAA